MGRKGGKNAHDKKRDFYPLSYKNCIKGKGKKHAPAANSAQLQAFFFAFKS